MLFTKIQKPAPGKHLVQRSQLYNKLNEGLNRKLILISAPAGFGKTTVLSEWIRHNNIPAAWFSIDSLNNDTDDFLGYVIMAIQSLFKELGNSALELLKSPGHPSFDSIITLLINDISTLDKEFLLVLDDLYMIDNSEINSLLGYLLDHMPAHMHMVISSRSDPLVQLARLRSQQQLVEIRSSDLSFSAYEISVLYNKKFGLKLSGEDASSLESKTEGWVAGLQLAALSMQGLKDASAFIESFTGNNRYIMDYLIEEVLKIQPDGIRRFLLETSILKQMSAPLANALANRNDSQALLEELENNNMFVIPLDTERNWYRYHHLFAALLKQKLQAEDSPATTTELHNRASKWFEQNRMFELAIEHVLEIKNYERAIQILGENAESLWRNGHHTALLNYGELLPDDIIQQDPHFCLYYSWILIGSGHHQKAGPFLTGASEICESIVREKESALIDAAEYRELSAKISVAMAYMHSFGMDPGRMLESSQDALDHLDEEDPLWQGWGWYTYGMACFATGDIQQSFEAYQKAFEFGKKSGNIYLISTISLRMADTEQQLGHYRSAFDKCVGFIELMKQKGYLEITKTDWSYAGLYTILAATQHMWADIDEAYDNVKIAYALSQRGKDIILEVSVLILYSLVQHERGDRTGSEKKIDEAEEIIRTHSVHPFITYAMVAWKAARFIELNEMDKAESVFKEYEIGMGREISHTNETAYMVLVRYMLVQHKLDEAESVLSELNTIVTAGKRIERLIDLKISYAILQDLKGSHEDAISELMEAMKLASDEYLLAFFVVSLEYIRDLLEEAFKILATSRTEIPDKFVKRLKRVIEKKRKIQSTHKDFELSAREMDTLILIAEELSNQEIANKLFISLNTAKTHVRNILLKLEVDSRTHATVKAKDLGII
ncbi:MAG: LuxR C-terminal-related transcriptional regulator [Bacteroidota bacterium]